jgi:3-hydroxybutyryl-CoA dehydrogenase
LNDFRTGIDLIGEFRFIRFLCKKATMIVAVIATKEQQDELMAHQSNHLASHEGNEALSVVWLNEPAFVEGAEAILNLRAEECWLHQPLPDYLPPLVIINAVTTDRTDWPDHFIRINGWPGFLKGPSLEATGGNPLQKQAAEKLIKHFGRQLEWVSDQPGFIGARVVSSIINEAYLTLQEKVSSKEDIDTAMRLGTNYPMGPFAWAKAIGIKQVYALLKKLEAEQPRYKPAALLQEEAQSK